MMDANRLPVATTVAMSAVQLILASCLSQPTEHAIYGQVVDSDGVPVRDVHVTTIKPKEMAQVYLASVHALPDPRYGRQTTTDVEGRYRIPEVEPGRYVLEFTHSEFARGRADVVEVDGVPSRPTRFALQRGVVVRGVIRNQDSRRVSISLSDGPYGIGLDSRSESDGSFRFGESLAPGTYEIRFAEESDPYEMMRQFQQSRRTFKIPRNRPEFVLSLEVPRLRSK